MIWSIFRKNTPVAGLSDAQHAVLTVFTNLHNLINREDLVQSTRDTYTHLSRESSWQPDRVIALYRQLEQFVLGNKPPVVKSEFTRDSIRTALAASVDIRLLPYEFRLLFVPARDARRMFFSVAMQSVTHAIAHNMGDAYLGQVLARVCTDLPVVARYTDGMLEITPRESGAAAGIDWQNVFRRIFNELIGEVETLLGQETAAREMSDAYGLVERTYGMEKIPDFFDFVQEKYLVAKRVSYLSREELLKQVEEATAVEQKKTKEVEEIASTLSGNVKELEVQTKNADEAKRAMVNLLEDARELENALKEERDRSGAIVSSMGEGLFVVDKSGKVILMNPQGEKLLDIKNNEVIGKNWNQIYTFYKGSQRLPDEKRPVAITLETGKAVNIGIDGDIYFETAGGKRFPASTVVTPLMGNGVTGAVVVFRDITREKESREEIERQVADRTSQLNSEKTKLSSSISNLPIGFVMIDESHTVLFINRKAQEILEVEMGSVRTFDDILRLFPKDSPVIAMHENYHKERAPMTLKSEVTLGSKILMVSLIPIKEIVDDETKVLGSIMLIDDITEAKVLERSRDEFFSIASHELRTPLTAIRGNTSMILEHYADKLADPELKEMINDVHESSIHLIDIVNDFLNTSRLEQRKLEFKNETFALPELIHKALKEYQVTGSRSHILLTFTEPAEPLPPVYADQAKVREVLINLIGNGLKFTENGSVTVSARATEGLMTVMVTDTGRGIPITNQALLFRKFQQAEDNILTRDTTKGTGLGLYISKLMVEGMGGKIWLMSSEPDKGLPAGRHGSTFAFTLPVAPLAKQE